MTGQQFGSEPMSVERHESGPRMSQVVVHGNTVYLAGVVARNNSGNSMTEQTKEILSTIDGYLAKAGTDKSKLLSANIWITDMADLPGPINVRAIPYVEKRERSWVNIFCCQNPSLQENTNKPHGLWLFLL